MDVRKPIFDALRVALGGKLSADTVTTMGDALDHIGVPKEDGDMKLSDAGETLIKKWEGYAKDLGDGRVQAYPDPATGGAPWTIGWGTTGPDVTRGTVWTKQKAQERFDEHITAFTTGVKDALGGAKATQDQFDAMVSLAYNVGLGNFKASTLLKKHKAGDYAGAKAEFVRWNKAAGRVMAGLTNRRKEEAALYGG